MDLKTKLSRLRTKEDLVLYKWTCGHGRVADMFIPLSNLRLNVLTCNGGRVYYSIAAPILYLDKGRSVIRFLDKDVLTVVSGDRLGVNILSRFLHEGEEAVPAQYCTSREIDGDKHPKWLEQKIMSMGCSPVYPVSGLIMPELFRMSRSLDGIKPLFTSTMLAAIGASRTDSVERLIELFRDHFELFGVSTPSGYVIPNEFVSAGGLCVAASRGVGMKSGSVVHSIPLTLFRQAMESRKWNINTGEPNELGRIDQQCGDPKCKAGVDGDDGAAG